MCCRSNISDVLSVRSHLYPLLDQPVQPPLEGLAMGLLLGEDGRHFSGTCGIAEGLEGMDPGRVPEDRAGPSHEVIGQAVERRGAQLRHLAPEPPERLAEAAARIPCGGMAVAGGDGLEDEVV